MKAVLVAISLLASGVSNARKFTVKNNCKYKVWPAIYTDMNAGKSVPSHPTGWEAAPGSKVTFDVPNDWRSGRIWGRRDCDFKKQGALACATGSCNGGLLCDKKTGTGVPPVTLAEWTLGTGSFPDNYDVSLVDGFNIPMSVVPTGGCHVADCKFDLNSKCPAPLAHKGPHGTAGCKTACSANLDGHPANSKNCCSGSFSTPGKCPPSGVQYYDYFKSHCKNSYAYAYDESSKTALWTCPNAKKADYVVTFCP